MVYSELTFPLSGALENPVWKYVLVSVPESLSEENECLIWPERELTVEMTEVERSLMQSPPGLLWYFCPCSQPYFYEPHGHLNHRFPHQCERPPSSALSYVV